MYTICTPYAAAILCPRLQVPKYAIVGVEGYTHGSKARYSCAHGYKLYGEEYATCSYGKWIGAVPTCKRKFLFVEISTKTSQCSIASVAIHTALRYIR